MSHRFTFSKAERLTGKKIIDELFQNGSSFYLPPFKVWWIEQTAPAPAACRVLISVPKKLFPLAIDRNRIKRHMREAYRLNKQELIEAIEKNNRHLAFALLYTSKKINPSPLIHEKIREALHRLAHDYAMAEKNSK